MRHWQILPCALGLNQTVAVVFEDAYFPEFISVVSFLKYPLRVAFLLSFEPRNIVKKLINHLPFQVRTLVETQPDPS